MHVFCYNRHWPSFFYTLRLLHIHKVSERFILLTALRINVMIKINLWLIAQAWASRWEESYTIYDLGWIVLTFRKKSQSWIRFEILCWICILKIIVALCIARNIQLLPRNAFTFIPDIFRSDSRLRPSLD